MNLNLLLSKPEARIDPDAVRGYLESSILEKLISGMEDLEAKADDCKKVVTCRHHYECDHSHSGNKFCGL